MDRLRELLEFDDISENSNEIPSIYNEIEVYSMSIQDALEEGAKEFNTSKANLEYEILEAGSGGIFGIGKKPYHVLIRFNPQKAKQQEILGSGEDLDLSRAIIRNADGNFRIFITKEGIMLKVEKPIGEGKPVDINDIKIELTKREILKYDDNAVKECVEKADGEWRIIAPYKPSVYDGSFKIEISDDDMKAYLTLIKPQKYGRVCEVSEIVSKMQEMGIKYGIKEDVIQNAINDELYDAKIVAAEGEKAEHGEDATIQYSFKTEAERQKVKIKEDGSVDYHAIENFPTAVVGQVLAIKKPATKGKNGVTIKGEIVPAKDGKDIEIKCGKNCHVSEDKTQIISDINGQIVLTNGIISVEPVLEIKGDVDMTTGDIDFPGNVIINGNVNDTFSVRATGNIEIKGNIGKAEVTAEGDLIVKQGIQGKDEGIVICGGNLTAKFIERANVICNGYVFVTEVILHSKITCRKKVICLGGKRSRIAGGRISALEEINAAYLGAESYTETILEVGKDPDIEKRMNEIREEKSKLEMELDDLSKKLYYLEEQVKSWGNAKLSPENQEKLNEFNKMTLRNNEIKRKLKDLEQEFINLQEKQEEVVKDATIGAEKTVYPNVKITIKNEHLPVNNEFQGVCFYKEGGSIRTRQYKRPPEAGVDESKDKKKKK